MNEIKFDGSELFVVHEVDGKWYVGGYNTVWTNEEMTESEAIIEDRVPFEREYLNTIVEILCDLLEITENNPAETGA